MMLSTAAAAATFGLINSIGQLGGLAGNYTIGYLNDRRHSLAASFAFIALVYVVAGSLVGFVARYGVRDVDCRSLQPMVREFTVNVKILCIEPDVAVLEGRCASLKYSGYDAASASPQVAKILLRSQKFDLLVISSLNDSDLHQDHQLLRWR
jgi:hypothetical protein